MEEIGKRTPKGSPPMMGSVSTKLDLTSAIVLIVASLGVLAICWFPYEEDSGCYRVPTIIFNGQTYCFRVFAVLTMFGYSASYFGLLSYDRPKLARFLRWSSVVFVSSAAAVLLFAVFISNQ